MEIPTEVSNRHVHLSNEDLEKLFGKNYELRRLRELSQPGQFAAEEKIKLINNGKELDARVLGPARKKTQVEISRTDARFFGLNPPVKDSGDLENSEKIILAGPKGKIELKKGLIIARRHLHISDKEAKKFNIKDQDIVSIEAGNIIFNNVLVRAGKEHKLALHLDCDEGNAARIDKTGIGYIRFK